MEESKNHTRNTRTLDALKEAGANMSLPHSIEHHIYSYTSGDYESISNAGTLLGYKIDNNGEFEDDDGKIIWAQDLIKETIPTISNIEEQSIEIEQLTEQFNSDYDGWGTEVEE